MNTASLAVVKYACRVPNKRGIKMPLSPVSELSYLHPCLQKCIPLSGRCPYPLLRSVKRAEHLQRRGYLCAHTRKAGRNGWLFVLCNASRLALWEECQWFPEVLDTVWSLLDFSPKLEYRIGAGLVKNANIIAVYTSG